MTLAARPLAVALMSIAMSLSAGEFKLMGSLAAESRAFTQSAQFPGQHGVNGSVVAQPELYYEWNEGRDSVLFAPFARVDQGDSARSHVDVRELTWVHATAAWELKAGIGRVFWGVAESNHLIDIVNQTDLVENLDTEDKLGQPMLNVALIQPWGTVDLFVLPGFRERTFPGKSGRLRVSPRVDTSSVSYDSAAADKHVDFAARYSHVFGNVDLGVYHFWGTSREPILRPRLTPSGEPVLSPHYDLIHQTGIDLLYTVGNWLWKFEGLRRSGQADAVLAMVGGFEYSFVRIVGSAMDLGALMEYHGDGRGQASPSVFNHDVFVGTRLGFNDVSTSQLLVGLVADLNGEGRFFNAEYSRRLGERWTVEAEARVFWSAPPADPTHFIEHDDYVQVQLSRYF